MRVTYDLEQADGRTDTVLLNSINGITGLIKDNKTEDLFFNIKSGQDQMSIGSKTEVEALRKRDALIEALNKYLDYHFNRYARQQIEYMMTKKDFS